MRKTDKKTDNQIRLFLTDICENFMKEFNGFQWLTHEADYRHFPETLKITLVFDRGDSLDDFLQSDARNQLMFMIQQELSRIPVKLPSVENHIAYATEQRVV